MTKIEASITPLLNNAAKGHLKTALEVMRWAQEFGELDSPTPMA